MAAGNCAKCGRAYGKTADFCAKCGEPIRENRAAPSSDLPTETAAGDAVASDAKADLEGLFASAKAADTGPGAYPADERALEWALSELDGPSSPPEVPEAPAAPPEPTRVQLGTPSYRLEIMNGLHDGKSIRVPETGRVVVGSKAGAELVIHGDDTLSRRHASFAIKDGGLYVQDEGSSNGTALYLTKPTAVSDGDLIILGKTLVRVHKEK